MDRDERERAIFLAALNLPGGLEGCTEEPERTMHAEDDPVLDGLAQLAWEAWAAFLAQDDDETP